MRLGATAFALLLALLLPAAAWAHAVLVESSPADGARLERPPAEVRLRFNEPVAPVAVHAFGPDGALALPVPATAADDGLLIVLPPGVGPGTYTVSYRVTSGDGHPVAGSLLFGVGVAPERTDGRAPPAGEQTHDSSLRTVATLTRALHYGSLLAAVGGALFVALVAPGITLPAGRKRVPLAGAARLLPLTALAAVAVPLNLGMAGALLSGESVLAWESWRAALASSAGASAGVALAGLALLALGLRTDRPLWERRAAVLAGGLVAVAALAATGHAATAPPAGLAGPLVALHGGAAAFWLGALAPLRAVLRHLPTLESAPLARRFSRGALAAVALLLATGAGLSLLQIADPAAVAGTAYGQLWLAKMVGVVLLLGLASANRLRLTPALEAGSRSTRERARSLLDLSVAMEMALMALVVALTATLGTTPPPRALPPAQTAGPAAGADPGYTGVTMAKGRQALIGLDPARVGANTLTLHLAQPDGAPFDPKELAVDLALPAAGIEPLTRKPTRAGPGAYRLDGLTLPVAGTWEIRIDALIDDFEKAVFRTALPVDNPR